jgi:uncharacterized protein (TIGR02147 family)
MTELQLLLRRELARRQEINPAFSLRAFAKFLGLSPASLSQMMSGKRGVSVKRLEAIVLKLDLPATDVRGLLRTPKKKNVRILQEDEFRVISEWYHFAILSLGQLKYCRSDPRWISRRLNIPMGVANEALQRLERLGIIEIKDGSFSQIAPPIRTTSQVPSATIRNYHRSILGLAQTKLETIDIELREFNSLTLAINTKNIPKARKLMAEFQQELQETLEKGQLDEIYQFSYQLFPLSNQESK